MFCLFAMRSRSSEKNASSPQQSLVINLFFSRELVQRVTREERALLKWHDFSSQCVVFG